MVSVSLAIIAFVCSTLGLVAGFLFRVWAERQHAGDESPEPPLGGRPPQWHCPECGRGAIIALALPDRRRATLQCVDAHTWRMERVEFESEQR